MTSARVSVLGLKSVRELMRVLGNPQDLLTRVHVVGTNGKGSVSAYLASVFTCAGYKAGRFSSPAVFDYNETVCIDGAEISQADFAAYTEKIYYAAQNMKERGFAQPTEFEMLTALAYMYFADSKCDIVFMEAGLGGTLDATNVPGSKYMTVVTPVGYDHTAVLGRTLAEIARNKADMLTPGSKLVSAPQKREVRKVLDEIAFRNGTKCEYSSVAKFCNTVEDASGKLTGQLVTCGGRRITTPLVGSGQLVNVGLAYKVCREFVREGWRISDAVFARGIAATYLKGRLEVLGTDPYVVIDGAHNPDAASVLAQSLDTYFAGRDKVMLTGIFADKDYETVLERVLPCGKAVVTFDWDNPRALSGEALANIARRYCDDVTYMPDLKEALKTAVNMSGKRGMTVAFGSLSHLKLISDAYTSLYGGKENTNG